MDSSNNVKIWIFSPLNKSIIVRSEIIRNGHDVCKLLHHGSFATTELTLEWVMFSTISRVSNGLTVGMKNPCALKFVEAIRKLGPFAWDFPTEDEVRGIFIIAQHNGNFAADFKTGIDTSFHLVSINASYTPQLLKSTMKVLADQGKQIHDAFDTPRPLIETETCSDCACCLEECLTITSCGHPICHKCVTKVRLKCPICRSTLVNCLPSGSYAEVKYEEDSVYGRPVHTIRFTK